VFPVLPELPELPVFPVFPESPVSAVSPESPVFPLLPELPRSSSSLGPQEIVKTKSEASKNNLKNKDFICSPKKPINNKNFSVTQHQLF
jgi:hypothetical protein